MVEGAREPADLADGELAVDDGRSRRDAVQAEDRHLGVVDEGSREEPAELPRARDRERRAAQLLGRERPGAGTVRKPARLLLQLIELLPVHRAQDRDDEALVRLHGEAQVVTLPEHDLLAVEGRVQLRELLQPRHDRLQEVREVRPLAA